MRATMHYQRPNLEGIFLGSTGGQLEVKERT